MHILKDLCKTIQNVKIYVKFLDFESEKNTHNLKKEWSVQFLEICLFIFQIKIACFVETLPLYLYTPLLPLPFHRETKVAAPLWIFCLSISMYVLGISTDILFLWNNLWKISLLMIDFKRWSNNNTWTWFRNLKHHDSKLIFLLIKILKVSLLYWWHDSKLYFLERKFVLYVFVSYCVVYKKNVLHHVILIWHDKIR